MDNVKTYSDQDGFHFVVKSLETGILLDALDLAKKEIAKMFWDEHKTEIMAQMDLKGLASLIAVYAAKEMVPEKK